MKLLSLIFLILSILTASLASGQDVAVYEGAVLSEDVTWRGSVLVRGSVVVAPQATLRIDPGTLVRFAPSSTTQLATLVVQGRIHAAGTLERPIVFTPDSAKPARKSWGGIVLLSTEKRNQLEHSRIEYVENGIDVRFSTVTLKAVSIVHAQTGILSNDSVVQMTGSTISDSVTGMEIHNSEFDAKEITVVSCERGAVFGKSAVLLSASKILNNLQSGLEANECRIKISGGDISGNTLGARMNGGEGQLLMTRFQRNKLTALHIVGSRLKIQRCLFADNIQDALRTEDSFALLLNNSFSSNGGFNIYNAGTEAVSARQNWWGTTDQATISQKNHDAASDKRSGAVQIFPWLNEKPLLMP